MGSKYHVGGKGVVDGKIIKVELWGVILGCGWGGRQGRYMQCMQNN